MTSNELEIFKQSILDEVRVMMQTTGQVTQYIGARYVPLFAEPFNWNINKEYEPLTIVTNQGNSYTSRQFVPKGVDISDTSFWASTGNYNAQIEQYRQEVAAFDARITAAQNAADSKAPVNHATDSTEYGVGNAVNYGHVKLSDMSTPLDSDANDGIALTPATVNNQNKRNAVVMTLSGKKVVNGDWLPDGYSCQGMTTDGTNLLVAYHSQSDTQIKIAKIPVSTMNVASRTDVGTDGHFNSMEYANGKIYASAGAGGYVGDYTKMAIIDGNTLKLEKIVTLPDAFWTIGVNDFNLEGETILDFVVSQNQNATFKVFQMAKQNELQPVSTIFPQINPSVIDQDIHTTNMYIAKLFSSRNGYEVGHHISFFGWAGTPQITAMLDIPATEETEGIAIIGTTAYISTFDGDIYSFDISKVWFNEYKTSARYYDTPSPFTMFYSAYNGTEVFDTKHVVQEFTCAPCYDLQNMGTVIAEATSFNDTSISATHYHSGSNHYLVAEFTKLFANQIAHYSFKYLGSFSKGRYKFTFNEVKCSIINKTDGSVTTYNTLKDIEDNGYLNSGFYFTKLVAINTPWYGTIKL